MVGYFLVSYPEKVQLFSMENFSAIDISVMKYFILIVPIDSPSKLLDIEFQVQFQFVVLPTSSKNFLGANVSSMMISVRGIAVMVQIVEIHAILEHSLVHLIILGAQSQIIIQAVNFLDFMAKLLFVQRLLANLLCFHNRLGSFVLFLLFAGIF